MSMLEKYGLPVERQVRRGRWSFDGAVTGTTILIEADGAYWHSAEHVQLRDARKDAWCSEHGYTILRVPEKEFYKSPANALRLILARWVEETGEKATPLAGDEE